MAREPQLRSVTSRERQAPVTSPRPQAFGAGVGQALEGLNQQLQQNTLLVGDQLTSTAQLERAHAQRQLQRERANAQINLINLRANFAREQVERSREMDPSLPEFTNTTQQLANQRRQEFLSGLSPDLQEEFAPQLETFVQSQITNAFQTETAAADAAFLQGLGETTQRAVDQILASSGDTDILAENLLGELDRALASSPLSKTAKIEQANAIELAIRSAQFSKLAQEEALGNISIPSGKVLEPSASGVYRSERPVATGLPAVAAGLLFAIAGPESSHEYNRRYSGEGAEYFTPGETWQHPRKGNIIQHGEHAGQISTAAGKYQFIKGTWEIVSERYGLADFSPENQDIGAWRWAQDYYADQTNGGNLQAALASGEPAVIERVRMILAEQWEGLKDVDAAQFRQAVMSQNGTPSALLEDPIFEGIPYTERQALLAGADAKAQTVQRELTQQYEAQTAQLRSELEFGLLNGSATPSDINNFVRTRGGTVEDMEQLTSLWEEHNETQAGALRIQEMLRDPSTIWDGSKEQRDDLDSALSVLGVNQMLAEGNVQAIEQQVVPLVEQSQIIPQGLESALTRNMYSSNVQSATAAFDTLAMLANKAPAAFLGAFTEDVERQTAAYNALRGYVPPNELIEYFRGANDPSVNSRREFNRKQVDNIVKDNPRDWTPLGIADKIGLEGTLIDGPAAQAIQVEAYELFRKTHELTGNERATWQAVGEQMRRRWGDSTINEQTRVMRYPPQQMYGTFDRSHDYIDEQFKADTAAIADAHLISDARTEQLVAQKQPPTYPIMKYDDNGFPVPVMANELDPEEPNKPARFRPVITKEMTQGLIERNRQLQSGLREDIVLNERIAQLDPSRPDEAAEIERLQRQAQVKRSFSNFASGVGEVAGGVASGIATAADALPSIEAESASARTIDQLSESGVPRVATMQRLLGEDIIDPLTFLTLPNSTTAQKARAIEQMNTIFDRWPSTPELQQLEIDFQRWARELVQ